jgi:hypothetical protein
MIIMYYGIDSDTAVFPTGAATKDFYIGRIGYGRTVDYRYFNLTGAGLATKKYGYWRIKGPNEDPAYQESPGTYNSTKAQAWGAAMANLANITHNSMYSGGFINTSTIFADVETGEYHGWLPSSSSDYWLNWYVYKGFADTIVSVGKYVGVYTTSGLWSEIMGTNSVTYNSVCLWGANLSGTGFNNPPTSMAGCYTINGVLPTIWQYYLEIGNHNPLESGDANIAMFLPN